MSHRVTTQVELRDLSMLVRPCQGAGVSFTIEKRKVVMTEGKATATLNLRTGDMTGEVVGLGAKLGLVRQLCAEAKYRAECERQDIEILDRTVDKDGNIVLMCSMR